MNNSPSVVSVIDDEKQARWDGPGFQPTAEPKAKPKPFALFERAVIDGQRSGRLPGDVEPRKAKIEIRVSERERAAYLERATSAGYRSVSDWIRSKLDDMHTPDKKIAKSATAKPARKPAPKAKRAARPKAKAKAKRPASKKKATKTAKASGRASGRRKPFVGTNRSAKTTKAKRPRKR